MNDRLNAIRQVAALALIAVAGMVLVAGRAGRLGGTGSQPTAALNVEAPEPGPGAPRPETGAAAPDAGRGEGASTASAGAVPVPTSDLYMSLPTLTLPPQSSDRAHATPEPTPTVQPNLVGIIAGHWEFDSGAVCPDGLREVDVTTDVALRVRALLEYRGYEVDLLPEHDPSVPQPPTQGYRGAALVAIHADSCDVPGVSGFKVARGRYSTTPEEDDALVACLEDAYAEATLLPRHDDTITVDMWNYYAFREVGAETPAAIIELGFLSGDRAALDRLRYEMALGVANGISCFLD